MIAKYTLISLISFFKAKISAIISFCASGKGDFFDGIAFG
jgi:hypothetical protein